MFGLHKNSVAFAATSFGSSVMGSVFGFAYVKVFLNRYQIQESWFHTAQVFYMIWNAVNDPLFGYFQDTSDLRCFKSRGLSIFYGAPLWAISFLIAWFPWGENGSWVVGIHLFITLSFYDALLTFVLLAWCAAFAEASSRQEDRLRIVRYSQWASMAGSTSVFIVVNISDNLTNYRAFQVCTVVIAIIAFFSLRYSGQNLQTQYDAVDLTTLGPSGKLLSVERENSRTANAELIKNEGYFRITWQILKNKNFLSFVITNFCQCLERALGSFVPIIGDALVPKELISPYVRAAWYGANFIAPQVFTLLGAGQVKQHGYFKVIRASYVFKIASGTLMFMIGFDQPWKLYVMILFMVTDTVVTFSTFSFFSMPLSDVIDEDSKQYKRSRPVSSMVFATNALVVKPADSISPMIAVAILNSCGYEAFKLNKLTDESQLSSLYYAMFCLVTLVPVILGTIQLAVWSQYKIRNNHLTDLLPKYVEGHD